LNSIAGLVHFSRTSAQAGGASRLAAALTRSAEDSPRHWTCTDASLIVAARPRCQGTRSTIIDKAGFALVFDGRLDNRAELLRALEGDLPQSPASSDAELVLRAYRAWGEAAPQRLAGEFAFALWDKHRRRLFCARDRCGARPFYYVKGRDCFAFASEEDALIGLSGRPAEPCPDMLAIYVVRASWSVDPARSWLRDTRTLLPAHYLTLSPGGTIQSKEYWRYEPEEVIRPSSGAELQERFMDVFGEAVRCRVGGRAPAGLILSGGMDSAVLAVLAGRVTGEKGHAPLPSYSAIEDDVEATLESRSIQSITAAPYLDPHFVRVPSLTGAAGLEDLKEAAWTDIHPLRNQIPLTSLMCAAAAREGRSLLLHAPCGDLAVGDYPKYIGHHLRRGNWSRAWRELRLVPRHHTYLMGRSRAWLLASNTWSAFAPRGLRAAIHRLRTFRPAQVEGLDVLNPDFVAELDLLKRIEARRRAVPMASEEQFRRYHAARTFGSYGVVTDLAASRRVSSRYGIELSDPWADPRVLDFFLRLPIEYSVRDGWIKYLPMTALAGEVEDWVRFRNDKGHLGWQVVVRLMQESHEQVEHAVHDALPLAEGYLDRRSVLESYQRYLRIGDADSTMALYWLVTLILWIERLSAQS